MAVVPHPVTTPLSYKVATATAAVTQLVPGKADPGLVQQLRAKL